jgi:hypothetical protein
MRADTISGTSAGAMRAAVLANGRIDGRLRRSGLLLTDDAGVLRGSDHRAKQQPEAQSEHRNLDGQRNDESQQAQDIGC